MSIGYPDFGRQVQSQAPPLLSFNANVQGQTLSSIVYCGDKPYIDINWDCTGLNDHYLVQLSFSDDAAGNVFSGASSLVTVPLKTGWLSYKAKGQYVQLIINNVNNTDTGPIIVELRGDNWPAGPYDSQSQAVPLCILSQSVAASSTVTITGATTIPGPATFFCGQGTAFAWQAALEYYDWTTQAWTSIVELHSTDGDANTATAHRVNLPAAPVRIQITNSSTAAHTMHASVVT